LIAFCYEHQDAKIEIDIVRDTYKALKSTAWHDFQSELIRFNIYNEEHHNKSDSIYILFGNLISYYGADTPDKIHGRSRDILWVNEAHQFPGKTIDQLFPRTRFRIICDYNPALGLQHWLDDYIEQFPPLITTYRDNPYLTPEQIADIESRKTNPYWWSVYGKGDRAVREGVVFENWSTGEFDNKLSYIYGQDFGFFPNPTTLVRVAINHKEKIIYAEEKLYSNAHLSLEEIEQINRKSLLSYNDLIVADSADPRLIYGLNQSGLNIVKASKPGGSVLEGINKMLDYRIVVTPESKNLIKELSNYVWNDRKAGVPVKANDHLIDAMRYAVNRLTVNNNISGFVGTDNLI
jgi:phage terminase large subunit